MKQTNERKKRAHENYIKRVLSTRYYLTKFRRPDRPCGTSKERSEYWSWRIDQLESTIRDMAALVRSNPNNCLKSDKDIESFEMLWNSLDLQVACILRDDFIALMKFKCKHCGKKYITSRVTSKFCSDACRMAYNYKRRKEKQCAGIQKQG